MKKKQSNFTPPPISETQEIERVMWNKAKKKVANFAHIKISLNGSEDVCECVLCQTTFTLELPGRTRQSLLLEAARRHYYKHKLDLQKVEKKEK